MRCAPSTPAAHRIEIRHLDGQRQHRGRGRIDKTVPVCYSTDDTFDVGEGRGTPMSPTYKPPSTFTGILRRVTVQV
jgi:hypothetical protein